ncbi:MAG: DegT/DnrJ/EryC1/StrS family aminotransferase, partial [Solirubrobacteraceae bacterium]|nr:DegT/DnrJ/EryC1/StrS family aminotransferase [Solirubrobacteraceae bacterium]
MSNPAAPIAWFGPHLTGRELERLRDVLDRQFVNDGPLAREFERRIAALVGTRHAVAVTSGTAAITLALMAAGIGPGDEVLVPALTFAATANAVRLAGAEVRLVDVEPHRFGIDPDGVAAAIGPRTRAVVTVDVNGRGADYARLEPICRDAGLVLICDSAEGLGSRYRGRMLGSFGMAGCFSFSANKTITAGQGGIVTTDSDAMHDRLRELKDQGRRHGGTGGDDLHPVVGFNFKFTDLQAAVALPQLDDIESRLAAAGRRDALYTARLANQPGLSLAAYDEPGEVRQWTDVLIDDRAVVARALDAAGIGQRAFWFPLHSQQPYAADASLFPVSSDISKRGMWLASRFDLTEADIERVCDT